MTGRVILGALVAAVWGTALAPGDQNDAQREPSEIVFYVRIDKSKGGQVLCALYDDEKSWLSRDVYRSAKTEADSAYATCRFLRIPSGTYAIAALHDEDRDGGMDYFLGLPLEGYAASRDAHTKGIGAPEWEDAIFPHHSEVTIQRARMKY